MVARAALVVVALAGLLHPSAAPAQEAGTTQPDGTVGIALVDAPEDRRDDPRARTAIVDHVAPGAVIERRIRITNTTAADLPVDLAPSASRIVDGTWSPPEGIVVNDLASWTTVTPATVEVPAGGEVLATVRIVVPADASPGERYAVVWAEPPPARRGTVTVRSRVGVRAYLSVGDDAEPVTDFRIDRLLVQPTATGHEVLAEVTNTGARAVDLSGSLALDDPAATRTTSRATVTLAPLDAGAVGFDVPAGVGAGPWTAEVTLRSGAVERTATVVLDLDGAGAVPVPGGGAPDDGTVEVPGAADGGVPIPLALLAVLALLVPVAVAFRAARA